MADELLDVVNDEDMVIKQAMRSSVHEHGLQHRGVHAILFTRAGKMLIQVRSRERAHYPSLWDCSVSEHVKANEDYHTAAMRGLKEELGVRNVDLQPLVRFRMNYGPNDNEISTLYKGVVNATEVRFDPVEIERVGYYSLSELQILMQTGKTPFSHWFVQLLYWLVGLPSEMKIIETYAEFHLPPRL
jgi:isopentenyl-diphosphate delta-isomerase